MNERFVIITFLFLVVLSGFVCAMDIPKEPNNAVIKKIDDEHKLTRNFIKTELTKKEKNFLDEFTDRADYYEESYQHIMNTTVWKLGFLWAGILLFVTSIQSLLYNRIEKNKYTVLKDALIKDIKAELKPEFVQFADIPDEFKQQKGKTEEKPEKKNFFQKLFKNKKTKHLGDKRRNPKW